MDKTFHFSSISYTQQFFSCSHFHTASYKPFPTVNNGGILEKCIMQQNKESAKPLNNNVNGSGGPIYGTLSYQTDKKD
jgi:hypothetical protein